MFSLLKNKRFERLVNQLQERLADDELYAMVGEELALDDIDRSAWTRAEAEASGDPAKMRAAYIEIRVRRLKDLRDHSEITTIIEQEMREKILQEIQEREDKEAREPADLKKQNNDFMMFRSKWKAADPLKRAHVQDSEIRAVFEKTKNTT